MRQAARRLPGWGVVIVAAFVAVWLSDALGARLDVALAESEAVLREHAWLGKLFFVVLAGASAMLAFFSSAVLVPSATVAWGMTTTLVLLWLGWIAGGLAAFAVGRYVGRAAVHRLVRAETLAYYEARVSRDVRWWMLLLLQLALPSELPGYLCGLLRVRLPLYLGALALGELPYAAGSVFLGEAFVERDPLVFGAVLVAGLALFGLAWRTLHGQLARRPDRTPTATGGAGRTG